MYQTDRLHYLARLVERHAHEDGINPTRIAPLGCYKASQTIARCPTIDGAGFGIVCQGAKKSYVGEKQLDFVPGQVMIGIYPIPVETEVIEASVDEPFLLAALKINSHRVANILSRLDQIENPPPSSSTTDPSNFFAMPLSNNLLESFIRLMELLDNPTDVAMLSDNIIDEIYYRLVHQERGRELRNLLQHNGDIQRISNAITYVHHNLNHSVSVDQLAKMVNMSRTAFFKHFKAVMHMSPLQYAKSMRLHHAQKLLKEGKKANQVTYMVGYNSTAQFSREYKRHFGFTPSETFSHY
jgi:AraC-like DNA-binding protein